jgi:quercetin dioxygenase-like cupin family protein
VLIRNFQELDAVPYAGGVEKRVVIGPKQGAPTFVMRIFDVPPGASSPYHSHDWEHEVFILSGKGVVVTEDGESAIRAEDAVFVPPDEVHCFRNTGQAGLRFMCLVPVRGEDTP